MANWWDGDFRYNADGSVKETPEQTATRLKAANGYTGPSVPTYGTVYGGASSTPLTGTSSATPTASLNDPRFGASGGLAKTPMPVQPGGVAASTKPALTGQSNILQRIASALATRRGTSTTGGGTTPVTNNSYYSQLAQMLTQRYGRNGITSAGQNGLLKNTSLYSNYLK